MEKIKKRAVLYVRVSTIEQVNGYSIQAQEQCGLEYAERMGYEVVEIYADEGESGKSTKKRLAYQRMMRDMKEDKFDLVIIWKLSRLGRNLLDNSLIVEELSKNGVGLCSISENIDIETSQGRLMTQMLSSFSEFERKQISENVQMTMKSLVKDQKRYAGGRRLGYVSGVTDDGQKQLIIEPEEAKLVQLIYASYLNGKGYRAIANDLNRQGYQTVKGNPFSTTAIKDILHNKIYGGYLEYARYVDWDTKRRKGKNPNPILVKGTHEPIIDEATYEAVQQRLILETTIPKWTHTGMNVLTGLLRCPECGAPMAASNVTNTLKDGTKKRIRYYSCSTFRNKGASVCHANSIRADKAESFVAERLKEMIQIPELLTPLVKELNHQRIRQVQPLEQELAKIHLEKQAITEKLTKWEDTLAESPELYSSVESYMQEHRVTHAKLHQRENEILSVLQHEGETIKQSDVKQLIQGLERLLINQEKQEIKAIYRSFIEKITFDPVTKDTIQLTMYFDQSVIDQLNEHYKRVVSNSTDTAFFVYKTPFRLTI